ncbi:MAG: Smr/MutS family protein [Hymenobacteraceae bacterium]|nr:Smr/MutS family protein [Hymenobacteraceae bacterium]
MQVGDRVRLMSGREEGTVTRVLENGDVLEVAIDGEFTIPLRRSDIVPIAAEEVKAFGARPAPPPIAPPRPDSSPKPGAVARPATPPPKAGAKNGPVMPAPKVPMPAPVAIGVYLVLTHQAEELLAVQLVNNSDDDLLFTYGEEKQERYLGRKSGTAGPRAAVALAHLHLRDFESWPAVVIQYLPHRAEAPQLHALETARVRFKASTFYNSRGPAPILKQEGYVFRLAEHRLVTASLLPTPDVATEAARLTEKLNSATAAPNLRVVAPPHEVDLHLDKLADAPAGEVNNTEALRLQMAAFQDALDRAIATSMHEIIFIHGVGTGALRKEIHRALSRDARIKFFEEAQKEKFGFGATKVRIK